MAAQELRTFVDMYNMVSEEVKIQSGDTVTVARIKRDINAVYLNEIVAAERWMWLRKEVDLTLPQTVTTGTIAVTQGSKAVTLSSAPATSKRGHLLNIQTDREVYKIAQHTAGATAVVLEAEYAEATNATASYQLWNNRIPLPSDTRETVDVWIDDRHEPLDGVGLQRFRQFYIINPVLASRPEIYTTDDYRDPSPYAAVGSLPALSTRASAGLTKTLVFASTVAALLAVGDRIEVSLSGDSTYNGEFVVATLSTTTITYTALEPLNEAAVADATLLLQAKTQETSVERYKELLLHPAVNNTEARLVHATYIIEPRPLEADTDEPLLPIEDRLCIVYGALVRAWSRERNPEEAARNGQLFVRKLAAMQGKLSDSTDQVRMEPSQAYLSTKRRRRRHRNFLID